jgi:hypothetical protein
MNSKLSKFSADEKRLKKNEVFDSQTLERIELANRDHPAIRDKIRGRKRYKTASTKAQAGIDEAIHQRRLRRLKALWNPEGSP